MLSRSLPVAALVVAVGAMKTQLVAWYVLPPDQVTPLTIGVLMTLFTAMTAGVVWLCFRLMTAQLDQRRKERVMPGGGETAAKEAVITQHAADWGLSRSEADVAIFVVKGFSNNEISEMRGTSVATVKSQLGSIFRKSGMTSRYQLIAFVTDEVVDQARAPAEAAPARKDTRKILPLVGRAPVSAPAQDDAPQEARA